MRRYIRSLFKTVALLSYVLHCKQSFGQIKTLHFDRNELPVAVQYTGQIVASARWIDKLGDNVVIATETKSVQGNGDNSGDDKEIYAYHFLIKGDSAMPVWKLYDFVKDCPVDLKAAFLEKVLSITDLNKNGIAETWLVYETVCRGDVSPGNMKIVMHEGKRKYALRGETRVHPKKNEVIGGQYTFDAMFRDGQKEFRNFADQLWKKHIDETW